MFHKIRLLTSSWCHLETYGSSVRPTRAVCRLSRLAERGGQADAISVAQVIAATIPDALFGGRGRGPRSSPVPSWSRRNRTCVSVCFRGLRQSRRGQGGIGCAWIRSEIGLVCRHAARPVNLSSDSCETLDVGHSPEMRSRDRRKKQSRDRQREKSRFFSLPSLLSLHVSPFCKGIGAWFSICGRSSRGSVPAASRAKPERNSRTRGKTISDVRVEFGSAARDHFIAQTAS